MRLMTPGCNVYNNTGVAPSDQSDAEKFHDSQTHKWLYLYL